MQLSVLQCHLHLGTQFDDYLYNILGAVSDESACEISDRTVSHYQRKQAIVRIVRQAIFAARFHIVTQQKKEEEAMKQRCNMIGKKDRKAQQANRCCTCYNMYISLFVCCTV